MAWLRRSWLPVIGWVVFAILVAFSLDYNGSSALKILFWSMGLLVAGSAYALRELHLLRRQGGDLAVQLESQHADLKSALSRAHEASVERDMVEDALNESEQRFYHLSEASFEAICIHDNGLIIDGNQNLAALFGGTLDQLIGSSVYDLYSPEFREGAKDNVKNEISSVHELVGLRRDASFFPMEVSAKTIPFNNRNVRVVAMRDLTNVKRHEKEREQIKRQALLSEGRRKAILNSSIDSILIFDQDDRIVDINAAAESAFGWTRDEMIGRTVADTVISPAHQSAYRRLFLNLKEGGKGFTDKRMKVRALRKGGQEFESEVATSRLDNENGVDFIASVRDIGERMEQQRKVLAGLTRMRALVQNLQDGILVLDEEQQVLVANVDFCRLLDAQQTPENIASKDARSVLGSLQAVFEAGEDFAAEGIRIMEAREASAPKEMKTRDGRYFERVYIPAFSDGQFQGHLWIYRDISENKKAEADLQKTRDAAIDSARFKSQFLANMSHEIRTPMNAIVGMTDLLLDTQLDEEQKDFAQTVKQASDSLLNLINQILDYSKIEAGKLSLENEDFDLRELMEGIVAMFAAKAHAKDLELSLDVDGEFSTALRGDAGRLGQVLVNLVGNAVKFTAGGEVLLSVRCEAQDDRTTALLLEVKDSGIGINAEAMTQLFKPFVQADGSITRRFGGTGLGLAISRELIELMGGEIGVDSDPAKAPGTRFWMRLCLDKQAVDMGAQQFRESLRGISAKKVLVVDDSATNRRILAHQLQYWGVKFGEAEGADEAMRMLRAAGDEPYDMLLLDMQMPDKDGLTLACEIKETLADPALRVLMMSSLGHSPEKWLLQQAGIELCLNKPIKRQALIAALKGSHLGLPDVEMDGVESLKPTKKSKTFRGRGSMRVLVAEDNAVNQRVVRSQLEKLGVQADIVSNGAEALEAAAKGSYSLLLMDCQMPVLDGLAATRELRQREAAKGGKRLPVVAMTANALEGDQRRCLEAGMDDYMPKPVKLENLERVIERWVEHVPSAAEGLPTLSVEELRRSLGEGLEQPGLLQELCELFGKDSPERIGRMKSSFAQSDLDSLRKEAHALKGSSRSLGLLRLGQLCEDIEKNEGKLDQKISRLDTEFQSAFEALENTARKPELVRS